MARPVDLPDYAAPPLKEVAISVQFDTLTSYTAVVAGSLWELFRGEFPNVQEQLPLQPTFETFGATVSPQVNLSFLEGPMPSRLWFLNDDQTELLQLQNDRFGRNWRKMPPVDKPYPRFETMIVQFERELDKLSAFCAGNRLGKVVPNQCELTYVNFVDLAPLADAGLSPTGVFRNLNFDPGKGPSAFNFSFNSVLSEDGAPFGRLHVQCGTMKRPGDGAEGVGLTLTARGAPRARDLPSAIERLVEFRERIVRQFDSMTTQSAHALWGRK